MPIASGMLPRREPDRTESMMLVYDGGLITDIASIRLAAEELASYRFVEVDELDTLLEQRLARRVRAALGALADGGVAELEHGVLV